MFDTKGDEPRWKTVYGLFENAADDEVVTYDDLADSLSLDPEVDRMTIQGVVHQASKKLLRDHNKALENVKGKGYRVATQIEHFGLAQRQQKKASRRVKAGHALVKHVDFNGMDADSRRTIEAAAVVLGSMLGMMRRAELNAKNAVTIAESVSRRQDRTDEQNTELRERLERLEAKVGGDA